MTRRPARLMLLLAVVGLLVLASGCRVGQDDEMARPTRTVTPSSSPETAAAPTTLPVGNGPVSPHDVVWAQATVLHVGKRSLDLAPVGIDSFVVVRGGVFLSYREELWFTDLSRLRPTGITGVSRLSSTRDDKAIRVELKSGAQRTLAYDALSGTSIPVSEAVPAAQADRLGASRTVALRPGRSDAIPASPAPSVSARVGPGGYGVIGGDGEALVAFDADTRQRLPLKGVVGDGFELIRWTGGSTFYGFARQKGRPVATVGCDLRRNRCTTFGKVDDGQPLVIESGP